MYRLTVVLGPNQGTSYMLQEGENSIGRMAGNSVILQSAKVSKRHCVLVASNGSLVVKDQGSSNGTFVNGVLSKEKRLAPGDRISVGEYVFELSEMALRAPALVRTPSGPGGQVIPFPSAPSSAESMNAVGESAALSGPQMPTDLLGKAKYYFERLLMPYFYGFNLRSEWKLICIGLFAAFGVANLLVSVQPLLKSSHDAVVAECGRRASFMARLIAERNAPFLAARAETKTEIGPAENAEGVRLAVLTDLDNRIIAPAAKINQYLTSGQEALIAIKARDLFRNGRETGFVKEVDSSTVVAIEPVKVLNPAQGKNVSVGMAIVSLDTSLVTLGLGDIGMIYSETLILTLLIGGFILLIMYRLTLKPFEVLGEDLEKALKGDLTQVTHEFQMQELNPLWDLVNSALQRLPKSTGQGFGLNQEIPFSVDEVIAPARMFGALGRMGIVVFDSERKVAYLNELFEELSGIRASGANGDTINNLARDQALVALVNDLLDRSLVSGGDVGEDFEFSGTPYRVHVASIGTQGGSARCYILSVVRSADG